MSILIGADIVPVSSNAALFENSELEELIGREVQALLEKADYRIFNLEAPLTDHQKPIGKHGPHLAAGTAAAEGLKAMRISLMTLANNHIMDQDIQGLESTISTLEKANIGYVGAGRDLSEAQKPFYFTVGEKRYGVYACAEHEFSIAGENQPGANPFDPLESLDHVHRMKAECDYAIVLFHGGKEYYRYPSPDLQRTCRKLIEKGADLVVCQHSHCIGCKEEYLQGTIVYGQGNFLFNDSDGNEHENTSLLIELSDAFEIKYHPLEKCGKGVRLARDAQKDRILEAFLRRSREIQNSDAVHRKYDSFAKQRLLDYVIAMSGMRRPFLYKVINKLTSGRMDRYRMKRYLKRSRYRVLNYLECEAHRELFIQGIKDWHC